MSVVAARAACRGLLGVTLVLWSFRAGTAGTAVLPEIPVPAVTPAQALSIAGRQMTGSPECLLSGLDWHKASEFLVA